MNIFKLKFIDGYIINGSLRDICSRFNAGDIIKVQYVGHKNCMELNKYWHRIKVPYRLDKPIYSKCIVDSYHTGNIGNDVCETDLNVWRLLEPI